MNILKNRIILYYIFRNGTEYLVITHIHICMYCEDNKLMLKGPLSYMLLRTYVHTYVCMDIH